jgi:outer membrane beta-barrel protein
MAYCLRFKNLSRCLTLAHFSCLLLPAASYALDDATTDVIVPEFERRVPKVDKIDSENIELTTYAGILNIEDFDSDFFWGARAAVHLSEHVFVEASYGSATGDQTSFEELAGAKIISDSDRDFTFWNISMGWNAFPGEAWLFGKAYISNFYFIAGAGRTEFGGDKWTTVNIGAGYRLFITDWMALRIDVRDHIFNRDLFGEDDQTNNVEISSGLSFFF